MLLPRASKVFFVVLPIFAGVFLGPKAVAQYALIYSTNAGAITLTGFTGTPDLVSIPSGVNNLGPSAFQNCTTLTNVTIPNTVTNWGTDVFTACSQLTNVTFTAGLPVIGEAGFYRCYALTNVSIPASVTNIGAGAFGACTDLVSITVDPANTSYSSMNGVLFDKAQNTLIQFPCGFVGNYTVSNGVSTIGFEACWYSPKVTGVTLPTSVTNIAMDAFAFCAGLTNVVINNGASIGADAFAGCNQLVHAVVGGNGPIVINQGVFGNCTNLQNVIIGSGSVSLGSNAFSGCIHLTNVFFTGSAPSPNSAAFGVFVPATVYYLPGTTGWTTPFSGLPAVLWNPTLTASGFANGQFGFTIKGNSNLPMVVTATTGLTGGAWTALQFYTLTNGSISYSDPTSSSYPNRFYGITFP